MLVSVNTEKQPAGVSAGLQRVFQALGDPTRREILRLLRARDMTAGDLAKRFPLARSTLSGHCALLKAAGLIVAERRGTTVVYSLNTSALEETLAAVMAMFGVGDGHRRRSR